jgi:phosphate transport system protein
MIRGKLDEDLEAMRQALRRMGEMVDQAIETAMGALNQHDAVQARQVIDDDGAINALRFDIEERCLGLIARQQPAAGDLRSIVAALNIVTDLERMGDHAAGIAKTVLRMRRPRRVAGQIGMDEMARMTRRMLERALQAYWSGDAEAAQAVASEDDLVDDRYLQIFHDLVAIMLKEPGTTEEALYLLFAAHNLERIADRATNISERVIFMTSGEMRELNPEPGEPLGME